MHELTQEQSNKTVFFKQKKNDSIWWIDNGDSVMGEHLFTFDKRVIYNLFADFPYKLTTQEREMFVAENPFWADFFSDRLE